MRISDWSSDVCSSDLLDDALLVLLGLTALTGLLLHALRGSELLGMLLLVHLGVVLGLFLCMPYGKFIHGFYRILALVGHDLEQRQGRAVLGKAPDDAAKTRRLAAE